MGELYCNQYRAEHALLLPRKQFTTSHMCQSINRVHCKVIKKTIVEKIRLQEKHEGARHAYRRALEGAQSVVMEQAELLRDQFGQHSIDYYYEVLMQCSRKTKGKRTKINLWNAFTRLEAQNANMCMYFWF